MLREVGTRGPKVAKKVGGNILGNIKLRDSNAEQLPNITNHEFALSWDPKTDFLHKLKKISKR